MLAYDSKAGAYVPATHATVTLRKLGLVVATDPMGRYLFRDLPSGFYTISAESGVQTSTRTVHMGAQPVDLTNVDFQLVSQFESIAPPSIVR